MFYFSVFSQICHLRKISYIVDPWRKSANLEKQKKLSSQMMAVCLADPDHPASYDPILGQAFADFFKTDQQGKDKTIIQFCDYLQVWMA